MANPNFNRVFGSTGTSATISDADYNAGWDNIAGSQPPTKTEFNAIDGEQDTKLAYLDKRARGEWNATYDYLANEVALGADGKWYKALINNTNKEPSVSATEWGLYDINSIIGINSIIPVSSVIALASSPVPTGFLECNGAAISRTSYSALFTAIGTTYGAGDGSTTFNLPDLRGEFIRGFDNSRGVDVGRGFGSWQADEFKSHAHDSPLTNEADATSASLYSGRTTTDTTTYQDITGSSYGFGSNHLGEKIFTTTTAGGAETRPRNIAMLYCIKY
jgi:microcystin-dependent protein